MQTVVNPPALKPPLRTHCHGVLVEAATRWLHISGQTGVAADGTTPPGFEAQLARAFERISYLLEGAGMTQANVVKINAFTTVMGPEVLDAYRDRRDEWLQGHRAAATVVAVAALARPELLVEVEIVAAAE
jgi:2-iminobutanoate/2-iminopropanoate deaminase